MRSDVLEDGVGIHSGDKAAVSICPNCATVHELKADDFSQNKRGHFEDGELYEFECNGCSKTIRLCTEIQPS